MKILRLWGKLAASESSAQMKIDAKKVYQINSWNYPFSISMDLTTRSLVMLKKKKISEQPCCEFRSPSYKKMYIHPGILFSKIK